MHKLLAYIITYVGFFKKTTGSELIRRTDDVFLQIVKTQRFTIKRISPSTFQRGLSIVR